MIQSILLKHTRHCQARQPHHGSLPDAPPHPDQEDGCLGSFSRLSGDPFCSLNPGRCRPRITVRKFQTSIVSMFGERTSAPRLGRSCAMVSKSLSKSMRFGPLPLSAWWSGQVTRMKMPPVQEQPLRWPGGFAFTQSWLRRLHRKEAQLESEASARQTLFTVVLPAANLLSALDILAGLVDSALLKEVALDQIRVPATTGRGHEDWLTFQGAERRLWELVNPKVRITGRGPGNREGPRAGNRPEARVPGPVSS